MANALYPKGREAFLAGDAAWDSDTVKVVAVDATYTYAGTDDFLNDVGAGARVATSSALTGKTTTDGVADANDVTYASLPAGDTITGLILFQDTGVEATSHLIAFYDTKADTTAINVPTNGGDVVVAWSNGSDRMFKL